MPSVPTYDIPTQDLAAGQMGTFQATGVAPMQNFAGREIEAQGKAILQAGLTMKKVSDQMKFDIADAEASGKDNRLAEMHRKIIDDSENGYMASLGKSAIDRKKDTLQALDDARVEIEKDIKDPLELQMFRNSANKRTQMQMQKVESHALQQTKVYKIGESKARADNLVDDAAANAKTWQDPTGPYAVFKGSLAVQVDKLAADSGLVNADGEVDRSSEQYKVLQRAYTTKLHSNVINNFLSVENGGAAAAYLKTYKGEIATDQLDTLQRGVKSAIETAGVKDTSLKLSMSLTGSISEQRAALDKMYTDGKINANVRDATMNRIEHNWNVQQSQQAVWEKSQIQTAQQWLDANKDKTVNDMPVQMQNNLKNTNQWNNIISYQKNGRFVTDPKAWSEIMSMSPASLAEMTPDQFYVKYRSKLDDQYMEKGYAMVAVARGDVKSNHLEIVTANERISRSAKEAKIIPFTGKPNEAQQTALATFESTVDAQVKVFEATQLGGKRKANGEELQKIIDRTLLDKVKIDEFGRDPEKPIALVSPEQMSKAYVTVGGKDIYIAKIPQSTRESYAQKLRNAGLPVTQQKIAAMWAADNPGK